VSSLGNGVGSVKDFIIQAVEVKILIYGLKKADVLLERAFPPTKFSHFTLTYPA